MRPSRSVGMALAGLLVIGCGTPGRRGTHGMNQLAERYVKLVLSLGERDSAYVDAYYGPPEWKAAAAERNASLADIDREAETVLAELKAAAPGPDAEELVRLRREYLIRQLESLRARVNMLSGRRLSFDEESAALYDAVAPTHDESAFESTLNALDERLPGPGALIERFDVFRRDFVIPPDKLASLFDLAIAECRRRTLRHMSLPAGESFSVEFVTNKSWSGYNWYQGQFRSLIQVNTDLPIYIDRAIDLACHEGYPGHHAYNVLLEKELFVDRGWIEVTVYPLFSPQSLIAEGTANYGIEVAFPADERLAFERAVLFPAAGLSPDRAARYYEVLRLTEELTYAGNEAARQYLNGQIDRAAAAAWLTRFAMMSPARAEQRTRFFDDYRSYVINYNLGKDLVKQFIESRGGVEGQPDIRWAEFAKLLGSPRLPSGLRPL
jgi:hypothetical protein